MKHLIAHWLWAISGCVAAQTIELERAREIDLDGLRGLGPATTRMILQERERQPFVDWSDLMRRVPGIGPAKAKAIRDASAVRAKFGVAPALVPDWLALVGDAADGYPGIAGIGAVGITSGIVITLAVDFGATALTAAAFVVFFEVGILHSCFFC